MFGVLSAFTHLLWTFHFLVLVSRALLSWIRWSLRVSYYILYVWCVVNHGGLLFSNIYSMTTFTRTFILLIELSYSDTLPDPVRFSLGFGGFIFLSDGCSVGLVPIQMVPNTSFLDALCLLDKKDHYWCCWSFLFLKKMVPIIYCVNPNPTSRLVASSMLQ